jgi:hypothetical protein
MDSTIYPLFFRVESFAANYPLKCSNLALFVLTSLAELYFTKTFLVKSRSLGSWPGANLFL